MGENCILFSGFLNVRVITSNFSINGFLHKFSPMSLILVILLLSLVLVVNLTLVSDVNAGEKSALSNPTLEKGGRGDFVNNFRTYQSAVRDGKVAFNKKDYQKAAAHYSRAIELSPYEANLYYDRGVALYKTGKAKEAIEDFDKVLVMDSRRGSAYVYRGLCREITGDYIEALKDYTSALGMNPGDASVHNNLAWLYSTAKDEKIQDRAKALEHAKKAAEISNERNAEILDTLARAYFINGMVREAVEAEKKGLQLSPGNKQFKDNLKIYKEGSK
jgi:tetratricopeptide (TPR) repeat protein